MVATPLQKNLENAQGFHLIQEFFIFTSDNYRVRKLDGIPLEQVVERQKELDHVLQRNLNNNLTASITILHNDDSELTAYLKA